MRCIRAVKPMDFYDTLGGDETEDIITENRIAAFREAIVYAFYVVADDEYVVRCLFCGTLGTFGKFKFLGTASLGLRTLVGIIYEFVLSDDIVHVKLLVADSLVEICDGLVAHLFDGAHDGAFVNLYLAVLAAPLQQLLPEFRRAVCTLIDGLTDFIAGFGGDDKR